MSHESKEATKKLLNALGIGGQGSTMPRKWNGSLFTFSHYANQLETFLSKGFEDLVSGAMVKMVVPLDPVQVLAIPAVPAAGIAAALPAVLGETDADFKIRRDYFQFDYKRCIDNNKDFNTKANAIVEEIESILDNTNRTNLEVEIRARNIPNLIAAFRALGVVRSANIGSHSLDQLKESSFEGYLIQDIKAVMDVTIRLSDAHREDNAKVGEHEKLVILLAKAATADSKDGSKFAHLIKDVETNPGVGATARTYQSVYLELIAAQNLYETKNYKGNIVDAHKQIYGKMATDTSINKSKGSTNEKCIGCRRNNHNIADCRSHYNCIFDKTKAHHIIKESCTIDPSKCLPPKKKIDQYNSYNNSIKSRNVESAKEPGYSQVLSRGDIKKAKKAIRLQDDQESKDYALAVKSSLEDNDSQGPSSKRAKVEAAKNASSTDLAEIRSLFGTLVDRFDTQDNHISRLQNDVRLIMRESSDKRNQQRDYDDERNRYNNDFRQRDFRQSTGRGRGYTSRMVANEIGNSMKQLTFQDPENDDIEG